MTENVKESAWGITGKSERYICHGTDGWTPKCCMARIGSGCCPCRCDPELDQLLREKLSADYLDEFASEDFGANEYSAEPEEVIPEMCADEYEETYDEMTF